MHATLCSSAPAGRRPDSTASCERLPICSLELVVVLGSRGWLWLAVLKGDDGLSQDKGEEVSQRQKVQGLIREERRGPWRPSRQAADGPVSAGGRHR